MAGRSAPLAVALWVVAEAGEQGERREVVAFRLAGGYDPRAVRHIANLHAALPPDATPQRDSTTGQRDGSNEALRVGWANVEREEGIEEYEEEGALPVHFFTEGEGETEENADGASYGAGGRGILENEEEERRVRAFGEAAVGIGISGLEFTGVGFRDACLGFGVRGLGLRTLHRREEFLHITNFYFSGSFRCW